MPVFHAMARRANAALTAEELAGVDAALFAEGRSLVEALQELGVIVTDEEAGYIAAFPTGLQEAVRALLHDNIASASPLDVTFAWAPGYEDELSLWQVADGERTAGGITVFIRSRFPEDRTAPGRGLKGT